MLPRGSRPRWWLGIALVAVLVSAAAPADEPALVRLFGSDFAGGAKDLYGASHYGEARLNYIYAQPTGSHAAMSATLNVDALPEHPLFLHVRGRLDDHGTECPLRIDLNSTTVFEGPNAFGHDGFGWRRLEIPTGALRVGANEVTFTNLSAEGVVGMPPWFMLSVCAVGSEACQPTLSPSLVEDFRVDLPSEKRPLPEPLPPGSRPGFALRGMKGWLWRPEQYLAEIPVLARYKMNFLMNCYGSVCDIEHHPWGSPQCNRWWEPLPEEKKRSYEAVVRECQKRAIRFCFSMNPNIGSSRIVRYDSTEDLDLLYQHYRWMQELGVKWFNVQFDDISGGIDAEGQARFVNALFARLRERDPHAQMIVCGTYYYGTGAEPGAREYLEAFGRELHPEVYVFWTGDRCVGPITRRAAESYKGVVNHRLIIWDNYPVNDANPTLHLGPVMLREAGLCEVCDGYMGNPLSPQNEINRLPLLTVADFAYNPRAYDPGRSIGQAILHLAETPEQRLVLKDLVELYPGMLIYDQGTAFNPVISRFADLIGTPHSRHLADLYIDHVDDVLERLRRHFPNRFEAARRTIEANLEILRVRYEATYGE